MGREHPISCCATSTPAPSRSTTSPTIKSRGAAPLGSVGLDWQLGGFAADPPTGSMGSSGSTSQLVQAMAGFGGGGAAESLNTVPLSADTSPQASLTAPQQHA